MAEERVDSPCAPPIGPGCWGPERISPAAARELERGKDGPASNRGPPGHTGCATHAQACGAQRGPGEDPAGKPAAAGAAPRAPALTRLHLTPPVTPQLAPPAPPHAAQQQHPQAEALHCGTHMVGAREPAHRFAY